MKWVEEPLFKSYVFLKITEEDKTRVRMVDGVVNFVYWLGKPAVIKNAEIEAIRNFLNEYDEVVAEPMELAKNMKVTIRGGALMDKEGKVIQVFNNKVQVVIESIGYTLVAVINKSNISMSRK
jgi:transcription antitermination factor NusG